MSVIMILAAIATIVSLFIIILGSSLKLIKAYKDIPSWAQGSEGGSGGLSIYYEIAFWLYKIKQKGRLTGTLSSYKWK